MKTIIYIILGAMLCVISCSTPVEQKNFFFHSTETATELTMNGNYEIASYPEWCTMSPLKGNKGDVVTLSVSENIAAPERTGEIHINYSDRTDTLTVTQLCDENGNYIDLRFDKPETEYTYDKETGALTIKFNIGIMPNVKPGQATVLDEKYNFNIRRIEKISISEDGTMMLETTQGDMSDLFKDIEFSLSTK